MLDLFVDLVLENVIRQPEGLGVQVEIAIRGWEVARLTLRPLRPIE